MDNPQYRDYVNRHYRALHEAPDLTYFKISIQQSDLAIGVDQKSYTDSLISYCNRELLKIRGAIEDYISLYPEFKTSLDPLPLQPGAPEIVRRMTAAAYMAGVGPMAAVAGAVAEMMGERLLENCEEVLIENGGDIFLKSNTDRIIAVFAGRSKFTYKIGIKISANETPLGICTSSGTVGPSLSFGKADAVVIKGNTAALADAVATGAANRVKTPDDLMKAVEYVQNIAGITGILAIIEDKLAAWGNMEIIPITRRK